MPRTHAAWLALSITVGVLLPRPASASGCANPPFASDLEWASVVLAGTVVDEVPVPDLTDRPRYHRHREHRIRVDRRIRGVVPDTVTVRWFPSYCSPELEVGGRFVVFAEDLWGTLIVRREGVIDAASHPALLQAVVDLEDIRTRCGFEPWPLSRAPEIAVRSLLSTLAARTTDEHVRMHACRALAARGVPHSRHPGWRWAPPEPPASEQAEAEQDPRSLMEASRWSDLLRIPDLPPSTIAALVDTMTSAVNWKHAALVTSPLIRRLGPEHPAVKTVWSRCTTQTGTRILGALISRWADHPGTTSYVVEAYESGNPWMMAIALPHLHRFGWSPVEARDEVRRQIRSPNLRLAGTALRCWVEQGGRPEAIVVDPSYSTNIRYDALAYLVDRYGPRTEAALVRSLDHPVLAMAAAPTLLRRHLPMDVLLANLEPLGRHSTRRVLECLARHRCDAVVAIPTLERWRSAPPLRESGEPHVTPGEIDELLTKLRGCP